MTETDQAKNSGAMHRTNTKLSNRVAVATALLLIGLVWVPGALAFDREAFSRLDPDELRSAEARMHELIEPGTARQLREARNPAEQYVIARQQRLAEIMQRRHGQHRHSDGSRTEQAFWPAARATRARVDSDGQLTLQCVEATTLLGITSRPDFRLGNHSQSVDR
jgi:hypothetical protein